MALNGCCRLDVDVRNGLPEQVPQQLPDPSKISLATVLSNHVILQVGPESFALHAHLQPGSAQVRAGQSVKRGQTLGPLGNSGNPRRRTFTST